MAPGGAEIAAAMRREDMALPPDLRLATLAEEPDIREALAVHDRSVWPEFLEHGEIADRHWHHLHEAFAAFQLILLDGARRIAASARSAPLAWDGTLEDLPEGWDAQLERSVSDLTGGLRRNTLGALLIVVDPDRRGERLGGAMVGASRACARLHGFRWLMACVRPTEKARYPLMSIEDYAGWSRRDGLPVDPWLRLHVRLGGRVVRAAPRSMRIAGTVAEWEAWTGMAFPVSGPYVVPGAAATVAIDRALDVGVHHDANVWVVHDLRD